jgi:hypothetical protein
MPEVLLPAIDVEEGASCHENATLSSEMSYYAFLHGAIAQRLELRTHNPSVVGSIPTCPTLS